MATLRQFIRDMTSLPVGSTIRDSINNPKTVGNGEEIKVYNPIIMLEGYSKDILVDNLRETMFISNDNKMTIELTDAHTDVSVDFKEHLIEI